MGFYEQLMSKTAPAREAFARIPVLQRALHGDVDHALYITFLGQAYHHVRHTVPLMMACGARLPADKAWLLKALAEYIDEEVGHEQWILDDIHACGGDAAAAQSALPMPATELMVAYAYDMVNRRNPLGFFGMVFVLEGASVRLASQAAAALRESLHLPPAAFRYLTSHGALDQGHMKLFADLMNRIAAPEDRDFICHSANMFFRLYGDVFRSISE